jgi:hypothetical protein
MKRTPAQRARDVWLGMPGIVRVGLVLAAVIVLFTCAGCNATLPILPGRVAIPVECKEPLPQRPAMPTDNLPAEPTLDASVQAMQAEIALREGYEGQLVTALVACTRPIEGKNR